MTDVGALIADMVTAGVSAELIGRVAAALAEREPIPVLVRDEAAERRREKDRDRQRVRRHPQTSTESADGVSPDKESPQTPKKITLSPSTPSPPKGGSVPTKSQFAEFWLAYPRKVGKGAARKAFEKAHGKLCADGYDPLPRMLAAVEAAKPGWDDPQFVPHPATWLNQERWDDETEPLFADSSRMFPSNEPIDLEAIRAKIEEASRA